MIFIQNNQIQLKPLVDLINKYSFIDNLQDAIDEYMISNKQKTVIAGEPFEVFYVSGLAEHHHDRLADYLNSTVLQSAETKAEIVNGNFANYPIRHFWLEIGDLIIDVTIRQFADKNIELQDTLKQFLDHQCFICDNPENPFYQLYQQ